MTRKVNLTTWGCSVFGRACVFYLEDEKIYEVMHSCNPAFKQTRISTWKHGTSKNIRSMHVLHIMCKQLCILHPPMDRHRAPGQQLVDRLSTGCIEPKNERMSSMDASHSDVTAARWKRRERRFRQPSCQTSGCPSKYMGVLGQHGESP